MKNQSPTPDREDIIALRKQGMNREDIAKYYGVALSRVKRWISDLDIPAPVAPRKPKHKPTDGEDLGQDYGLTKVERAKQVLGSRMGQDYRGYLLDGRPVRVDILIQAAGLEVKKLD
jgi:transposase